MFPTFKPPRCREEYSEFLEHLRTLRKEIYNAPLSLPHTLAVILIDAQILVLHWGAPRPHRLQYFLNATSQKGVCVYSLSFPLPQK
jgi:hypothetical protein